MIRYVFRRMQNGKRSAYWTGRYAIKRGDKPREVATGLTDKTAALAFLDKFVVDAQRAAEGILPARSYREAAQAALADLLADYTADIRARGKTAQYANVVDFRVGKIIREAKWSRLADVTPQGFMTWRTGFTGAPKTLREYQTMLSAFLNWLVASDRLERNPLAKVKLPETRGKAVRPSRAFTLEELGRIFAAAETPAQRLAYMLLAYTGQRAKEIASLTWGDISLGAKPFVLIRETTTKDKKQRALPLHPQLFLALKSESPLVHRSPAQRVFADGEFPRVRVFLRVLKKAGIERKDALGRVVHLHSFRKTFQTLGVLSGVNQRAAQEFLGHTDANLTAKVYTDIPADSLHGEIAKLPWPENKPTGEVTAPSGKVTENGQKKEVGDVLADLLILLQSPDSQGELSKLTASKLTEKMERAKRLRLTGNSSESAFGTAAEPTLQQFADATYGNTWRGFDVAVPQWLSPYAVYDYYRANPGQFYDRVIDFGNKGGYLPESEYGREKEGNKESTERVFATYLMATANISKLTVLAGARYEATWLEGWGNVYDQTDDPYKANGKYDVVTPTSPYYRWDIERPFELADLRYEWRKRTYDYARLFPNLQLKYDITPNFIARASYTTGMGRPKLDDILWATDRVTPAYKLIRRPNPELVPQTNDLYQVRLEYYFKKFGSATLSAFYQPYKNYIYSTSFYEPYTYSSDDELLTELWEVQMNRNVGDGRNYGVEASYQQRLGFIAKWLDRIEFYASVSICDPTAKYPYRQPADHTLTDSEAEEWNNSPVVWKDVPLTDIKKRFATASLSYKGSKFSASVTAMWTDEYTRSIDTDTLAETRYAENIRMDLSMNYRLSRHWQAYFDWRNFTDVSDERSIFERTAGYYVSGMVINVGVRADF
jgi:integrase